MAANLVRDSRHATAYDVESLTHVLAHLDEASCPRFYNFHMHTTCSDGRLDPWDLAQQALDIGLKGFAITDHHSIDGYRAAKEYLSDRNHAPQLWTGLEISSQLLDDEVHILCYAFDPDHPALAPYLTGDTPTGTDYQAVQVIDAIHQAGGLTILAHPVRYRRSPEELIATATSLGIDGAEVYYAYNNPSPWKPSPRQTERVRTLAQQYGLLMTCGTDSHGFSLLQRL
jgi:predicted metal-dependent phosphoesterase TrpH